MSSIDPLIGQQLGNYLIQEAVGRGGMARVYKGLDIGLNRAVAVKVIEEYLRSDTTTMPRFEREARAVANLRHPHIMSVYYFGHQDDNLYYLVMEYIDGANLDVINRSYRAKAELMPHADILRILEPIASALDYAHSNDVIHRDVKPSNIMIERLGRPILTDFGLAFRVSEGSIGEILGTPHYISPEQARNSASVVPQSDVYALGVVAFELLTGIVPFDDPSPTALALQHFMIQPPSPRAFNRNLSREIERVLFKVLAKAPKDRFQTSAEFMGALREALDHLQRNPVVTSTADLPPLPPGVVPPSPRRLSTESAFDKLHQETALRDVRSEAQRLNDARTEPTPPPATPLPQPASPAPPARARKRLDDVSTEKQEQPPSTPPLPASPPSSPPPAPPARARKRLNDASAEKQEQSPSTPPPPQPASPAPSARARKRLKDASAEKQEQPSSRPLPPLPAPHFLPTESAFDKPQQGNAPSDAQRLASSDALTGTQEQPLSPPPARARRRSLALVVGLAIAVVMIGVLVARAGGLDAIQLAMPIVSSTEAVQLGTVPTAYPNRWLPVRFIYDADTFYWMNDSTRNINASTIAFERVGGSERFAGSQWAYWTLEPGRCMEIRFADILNNVRPDGCRRNAYYTPIRENQAASFWSGTGQFRVLWNEEEIAVCEIAAGECAAGIPRN